MTALEAPPGDVPADSDARDALAALGSVGATIAATWIAWTQQIATDVQSMTFFTILCSVAAVLLGAFMLLLRRSTYLDMRVLLGVALVFTVAGIWSFLQYEHNFDQRVAFVRENSTSVSRIVVTDIVTQHVLDETVKATGYCDPGEIFSEKERRVSFGCAKVLAAKLDPGADGPALFNMDALAKSREILVGWYRLSSALLMLALFFAVDWFLNEIPLPGRSRARTRGPRSKH